MFINSRYAIKKIYIQYYADDDDDDGYKFCVVLVRYTMKLLIERLIFPSLSSVWI